MPRTPAMPRPPRPSMRPTRGSTHPRRLRFDQCIHRGGQSDRRQCGAGDVDAGAFGGPGHRAQPKRQGEADDHRDRRQDIDPSPAQEVHGQSPQQRPQRKCGAGPGSPGPDRRRSVCAVERGVDQRERAGHQKRAAQPLDDAPGDQHRRVAAVAANTEPVPKATSPKRITGTRPNRSEMEPPGRIMAARASK